MHDHFIVRHVRVVPWPSLYLENKVHDIEDARRCAKACGSTAAALIIHIRIALEGIRFGRYKYLDRHWKRERERSRAEGTKRRGKVGERPRGYIEATTENDTQENTASIIIYWDIICVLENISIIEREITGPIIGQFIDWKIVPSLFLLFDTSLEYFRKIYRAQIYRQIQLFAKKLNYVQWSSINWRVKYSFICSCGSSVNSHEGTKRSLKYKIP